MPSSIMSSSGPTGEAPQIPGTYAQYDNGANIFNYYNDFISSSSLTGWNTEPEVGISANHGLTITSSGSGFGTESPYSLVPPFVYEAYGEAKVASGCIIYFGLDDATCINTAGGCNVGGPWYWGCSVTWEGLEAGGNRDLSSTPAGSLNTFYLLGQTITSSNVYWYINYGQLPTSFSWSAATGNAGFWVDSGDNQFYYWMRVRAYPPSGVMPTVSLGTAV